MSQPISEVPAGVTVPEHAPGEGPFHARGVVYLASLEYVRRRSPGGLPAVLAELPSDDLRRFFDQILLAGSRYDVLPLIELHRAASRAEGTSLEAFARARARESADIDVRGIYRVMLRLASPGRVAENLPRAFGRYFAPSRVESHASGDDRLEARFVLLPSFAVRWYRSAVEGFVSRALELAGAADVRFRWGAAVAGPELQGEPTSSLDLEVSWR